jgi:DNA-binding response OmpR family regulator
VNTPTSPPERPLVLVVDDDKDIRELVALRLMRSSYRVVTARDGEEALEKALELRPELIVLDVNMPGPDGFETSRRLRADPRTSHVPIVFLTARTREADVETGYARGGDSYLTKPFDPIDLVERVDALIGVGRMRSLADPS